jgi:hypothetical protein
LIRLKRNFPKALDIGDAIYRVKFVRYQDEDVEKTGLVHGMSDPSNHTIYLTLGQSPRERFKSLVHEVLECMKEEFGLRLPHYVIEELEEPITRFLEDNRLLG